jgi:hypothetical protein
MQNKQYQYKKIKTKLCENNTAIWYNKSCRITQLTPTYASIKVNGNNPLTFLDPCIMVKFIKENPTRCNNVSKCYNSIFIWRSTCFGRHTAHHQEPKTALAASSFSYVEGCWTSSWWTLPGTLCLTTCRPARPRTTALLSPRSNCKTRSCYCSCRALDDGREDTRNRLSCN